MWLLTHEYEGNLLACRVPGGSEGGSARAQGSLIVFIAVQCRQRRRGPFRHALQVAHTDILRAAIN